MRLVCPNCEAHYEVPDDVIPPDGRDVQCSNCGKTWFQAHPDQIAQQKTEDEEPDWAEPARPQQPREMDEGVRSILQEEADFEAKARAEERERLESQPDLGFEDDPAPARKSSKHLAQIRGETSGEAAAAAAVAGSRRDLLPDIEEINSTLRSNADRTVDTLPDQGARPVQSGNRRSFRLGYSLSLSIFAALILIYAFAPQIARALPAVDPLLSGYVSLVDTGRLWLNDQLSSIHAWLDATAEASRNQ